LLNSNTFSTCLHNMVNFSALTAEIGSLVWDTQQISTNFASWRHYCTDVGHRRPTNFARCLAVSWAGTLCIHFRRLLPLTQFFNWQVQNSLCVKVLRYPILVALLHGTPAAGISQTLSRGTRNGFTELSQSAPPIFGFGGHHVGHRPTF